jgi:hypothetical protein
MFICTHTTASGVDKGMSWEAAQARWKQAQNRVDFKEDQQVV